MKIEPMEPFDIDNIIKNKLRESNDLHSHEMDSAKPFVWSAVQNQIGKSTLTWVHLAAAIVLVVLSFSFVLYYIQKGRKNEIELLSNKVDQLQKDYLSQAALLQTKDTQVASLGNELKNVELQLTDLQKQPLSQKETFVYRTDTIYVKQVEYITIVSGHDEPMEIVSDPLEEQSEQLAMTKVPEIKTDDAIFPSYSNPRNKQTSESIKLKFGSFTAKN